MPKTSKIVPLEKYDALFAMTLRRLMERHPESGVKTTQKELAQYLGTQPQTVSLYCTGESLPNCDQLLKIADYFGVTADFLITGRRVEHKPVRDLLGLSEHTVNSLSLIKEGYFETCPQMLAAVDFLLGSKEFYLAIEEALIWHEKRKGKNDDYQEFCEWKAAQMMGKFLLAFFRYNFESIYTKMRGGE
jgi:transcriptional regulator with XRE-family HTH domain